MTVEVDDAARTTLRDAWRDVVRRDPHARQYRGAVRGVLASLGPVLAEHPEYADVVARVCEPERVVTFRVAWTDDAGRVRVNRGMRVRHSTALGAAKGGLRFAPSVSSDVIGFLAFEQVFKNALTGQAIGGGKGGADVDPKSMSEGELMRFCQAFMTELHRHVGAWADVPAGDMGVGPRELGWMLGQYQRLTDRSEVGVLTGKPGVLSGSALRPEATGYGLVAFLECMLAEDGADLQGLRVAVSGSGNVALHAMARVVEHGGIVVGASDSRGALVDASGIDVDALREIKGSGGHVADYAEGRSSAETRDASVFTAECDVALPCATQNELGVDEARSLASAGCRAVAEGANGPVTPAALEVLREAGVAYGPGKAANAGGVAVSALEMEQNAQRTGWSAETVDDELEAIMSGIHGRARDAAERYCGDAKDLENGANAAGFVRVAEAVRALGVV